MVSKNITIPHRFVCLTNTNVPCESIPLERNWPGWWSKIELFRPGLFEGQVFYLDLDTVILKNIDNIVSQEEDFIGLRPFNPLKVLDTWYFASGLLGWKAGKFDFLYEDFDFALEHKINRGDQDYLSKALDTRDIEFIYWQDLVDGIFSYKRHVRNTAYNVTDPSIICFHGSPRPWEVKEYENISRK